GYKEGELIGKSWVDLFLYEEEKPKITGLMNYLKSGKSLRNSIGDVWKSKYGTDIELIWTDSPIFDEDGKVVRVLSMGTDITEQKNLVRRLNNLAYYDSLTGLPNRFMLKKEAEKLIVKAKAKNQKLAFLNIDIDNFKQINDTLGHTAGDKLLVHLSEKLLANEDIGCLSKLGEDEYCVILDGLEGYRDIVDKTNKILDIIRQPWGMENYEFSMSASIGISVLPSDGEGYDTLMRLSNMAMNEMKRRGKNGFFFYQTELGERVEYNTFIVNQIYRAIENGQLGLQYQPIIDIKTGKLYSVESLVRWNHPDRGYIPPMEFIPLIEETGQIFEVTSHILKMAVRQKRYWIDQGYNDFKLGVNISTKSLIKCGIDREINGLLNEYNVDPSVFNVEITETAFMNNSASCIESLFNLESLGVTMALDDFGTGYSSLAQLKNLPIQYIKIDMEFIRNMKRDSEDEIMVRTIVDLAHNLGLKVVAEGVETREQLDILRDMACDFAQGYYISRPLNPEDFEGKFLANKR
ncbi:MAG: EAL domain-containing protein, partial [Tissierellaceae bacterium]